MVCNAHHTFCRFIIYGFLADIYLQYVESGTQFALFIPDISTDAYYGSEAKIYMINTGPCVATTTLVTIANPAYLNISVEIPAAGYYEMVLGSRFVVTGSYTHDKGNF